MPQCPDCSFEEMQRQTVETLRVRPARRSGLRGHMAGAYVARVPTPATHPAGGGRLRVGAVGGHRLCRHNRAQVGGTRRRVKRPAGGWHPTSGVTPAAGYLSAQPGWLLAGRHYTQMAACRALAVIGSCKVHGTRTATQLGHAWTEARHTCTRLHRRGGPLAIHRVVRRSLTAGRLLRLFCCRLLLLQLLLVFLLVLLAGRLLLLGFALLPHGAPVPRLGPPVGLCTRPQPARAAPSGGLCWLRGGTACQPVLPQLSEEPRHAPAPHLGWEGSAPRLSAAPCSPPAGCAQSPPSAPARGPGSFRLQAGEGKGRAIQHACLPRIKAGGCNCAAAHRPDAACNCAWRGQAESTAATAQAGAAPAEPGAGVLTGCCCTQQRITSHTTLHGASVLMPSGLACVPDTLQRAGRGARRGQPGWR